MSKQSQASMEFLISYGWALLIVLVVIITLVIFGIIDTNNAIPDSADLGADGLFVRELGINATHIFFLVYNGQGRTVYNFMINVTGANNSLSVGSTAIDIPAGVTGIALVPWGDTSDGSSRFVSSLIVNYTTYTAGLPIDHTAHGMIQSTLLNPYCGDAVKNGEEECDTDDFSPHDGTCADYYDEPQTVGDLECFPDCVINANKNGPGPCFDT